MRFLVLFICLVCVFDIYCTVKYEDSLPFLEENLIARTLIYCDGKPLNSGVYPTDGSDIDSSRLIAFKCLGLLAAADILEWMVKKNTRWSKAVIYCIVIIQLYLLFYLVK